MKEAELLAELGASFRALGGWWYKIPDASKKRPRKDGKDAWQASRRPFDAIAHLPIQPWDPGKPAFSGWWFAIETKVARSGNPEPGLKRVAEHQWDSLQEMAIRGMIALVLVLVYGRKVEEITNEFYELAVFYVNHERTSGFYPVVGGLKAAIFLQREDGRWPVEKL